MPWGLKRWRRQREASTSPCNQSLQPDQMPGEHLELLGDFHVEPEGGGNGAKATGAEVKAIKESEGKKESWKKGRYFSDGETIPRK
ncbi:Laminin Subunit Gamma-2 [Manis pentadactyla]|nr:Laminin Subunit Gamma-2 [Manis pentadactyla]